MKANEAPERIYCESDGLGNIVKVHNVRWPDDESENIEYTRTDAFIEKTVNWLINNTDITPTGIKNYRKAMKDE